MGASRGHDNLLDTIGLSPIASVVTDPRSPDNPIAIANAAFESLTGYREREILGRNCRFLAGGKTEPWLSEQIATAVRNRRSVMVDILNYRSDGSPFRNGVTVIPLYDDEGELAFFLGSQVDLGLDAPTLFATRQAKAAAQVQALPARQRQVLELVAKGQLNKQIAYALGISEKTVKMHRAAMLDRLECATSADAIRVGVEAGLAAAT